MASSASPVPASPAHSYHNRFGKETTPTTTTQQPAFDFDFGDFKGFDTGADGNALGSFAAYQTQGQQSGRPVQVEQAAAHHDGQEAELGMSHEQSQDSALEDTSAPYDQPSKEVAALEAAIAQAESPPAPAPAEPSAPLQEVGHSLALGPQDALGSHLDSIDLNRNQAPIPHDNSDSAVTVSTAPATAFDAPSRLSTAPSNEASPPLRYVQSQQPVISPGAADTSGISATAFPQSESTDAAPTEPLEARERPNSFFGMERPLAAVNAAGQAVAIPQDFNSSHVPSLGPSNDDASSAFFGGHAEQRTQEPEARPREREVSNMPRPSSFFFQGTGGTEPTVPDSEPSQAAKIAARHRAEANGQHLSGSISDTLSPGGLNQNRSTQAGGTGNAAIQHSASFNLGSTNGRPASIAPSVSTGPLLDHSHLKPGQQAALLSHNKTLELYRQNAKKTNDPDLIYEFAVFMVDASKSMPESPTGGAAAAAGSKEDVIKEATGLLKKIAERGHPDAQYFLADCYANGIGTPKMKQDFDRAYPLFVLAAKHGHPDAAYRAGTCYEKGWGCRRDSSKALQFYRKAAAMSHPGAMYRLATAELNGELGLKRSAKEGVKWLKRSADAATPEFPHALHELALLHERGIDNILFVDPEYSCELLAQAGEMGYAPSAYKLGVNYEYGRMGCPQDAGLSIHMYNIAAQQNHKEACFALTAWYLVGAPSILPQSDTEAYLWAKKAAEQELAKAEYAVGYFTEMGIGTVKDIKEAREWYKRAAMHGDKRANQRLTSLGGKPVQTLAGIGAINGKDASKTAKAGQHGGAPPGSDYASLPAVASTQPTNAPFPSRVEVSGMSPTAAGATSFPSPLVMRDQQTAQRGERYLANVAATQQAQHRASMAPGATSPSMQPMQQQRQSPRPPSRPSSAAPASASPRQSARPFMNGERPYSPQQAPSPRPGAEQSYMQHPNGFGNQGPPRPFVRPGGPPSPEQWSQQQSGRPLPRPQASMPPYASAPPPSALGNGYSAAAAYPSYPAGMTGPPGNGAMRPPPIDTGMNARPRPPPNALPQSWIPGSNNRNGGPPSQGAPAPGAMPYGLESDDAIAAQILARSKQQQQMQSPQSAGADQPKKKKGWFGGKS